MGLGWDCRIGGRNSAIGLLLPHAGALFDTASDDVAADPQLQEIPHVGRDVGGRSAEQGNDQVVVGDDETEQAHQERPPTALQPAFAPCLGDDDVGRRLDLLHLAAQNHFLKLGFDPGGLVLVLDGLVNETEQAADDGSYDGAQPGFYSTSL